MSIVDPIVSCAGVATGVVLVRDNDFGPGLDCLPTPGSVCTRLSVARCGERVALLQKANPPLLQLIISSVPLADPRAQATPRIVNAAPAVPLIATGPRQR
jgi:hypothetical protein